MKGNLRNISSQMREGLFYFTQFWTFSCDDLYVKHCLKNGQRAHHLVFSKEWFISYIKIWLQSKWTHCRFFRREFLFGILSWKTNIWFLMITIGQRYHLEIIILQDLHCLVLRRRLPVPVHNYLNDMILMLIYEHFRFISPALHRQGVPQGTILSINVFNVKFRIFWSKYTGV